MISFPSISPFGYDHDRQCMELALTQARHAFNQGEVPIGAVLVDSTGTIRAQDYNRVEQERTQAAHAEILVLRAAGAVLGDWRLLNCWLYVTLEPCSMCFALIQLSRCTGVLYATRSPLFGYQLDNTGNSQVYKKDILIQSEGLLAEESRELLKEFFQRKRKKE